MNKERLQQLANHLRTEKAQKHFDLNIWFETNSDIHRTVGKAINECGAVACIAGHAFVLSSPSKRIPSYATIREEAKSWLELLYDQASELFLPNPWAIDYDKVTAKIAADVIEGLIKTGEVVWPEEVLLDD